MALKISLVIGGNSAEATQAVKQLEEALARLAVKSDQAGKKFGDVPVGKPFKDAIPPIDGAAAAIRRAQLQTQQLAYQFNDIGVSLASGQSPFLVMLQQGSQIGQVLDGPGGLRSKVGALGTALVTSLANPVNLAFLGFGAALTAATALFSYIGSGGPSVADSLGKHAELVKEIRDAWDGAAGKVKDYSETTQSVLLSEAQENEKRLKAALDQQLKILGSGEDPTFKYQTFAGVPVRANDSRIDPRLPQMVTAFNAAVEEGTADVKTFRDDLGKLKQVVGQDSFTGELISKMLDLSKETGNLAGKYSEAQKLTEGLGGKHEQLTTVLNQGSAAAREATSSWQNFISEFKRGMGEIPTTFARALGAAYGAMRDFKGLPQSTDFSTGASAIPGNLAVLFGAAAQKYDLDLALLASIAKQESGFNQGAVSPKGARGIMQLMPDTAAGLGVDAYDPAQNIEGGAKYLRQMLDRFGGDTQTALAGYNWGPGNVEKWLRSGGGINRMPAETRNYVSSIMGGVKSGGSIIGPDSQEKSKAAAAAERERKKATDDQTAALKKAQDADAAWAKTMVDSHAEIDQGKFALTASTYELARATKQKELMNRATQLGIRVTGEVQKAILAEADAHGRAAAAAQKHKEAQEQAKVSFAQSQQQIAQNKEVFKEGLGGFLNDLKQGASLMEAFGNAAARLGQRLQDTLIDKLADLAFGGGGGQSGGGGWLDGLLNNLFDFSGGGGGAVPAGIYHSGGTVGASRVPMVWDAPELYRHAPRLHQGLMPGERRVIMEEGEGVIPKDVMRRGGLGGQTVVNNFNVKSDTPKMWGRGRLEAVRGASQFAREARRHN